MNARDNIKPKSIRLAILIALADGEITTIDDLLLKVDEPRNKLVNNAQAAHNEGLIKRMRDDVTNQAAYQITADGRKYIAKYADGSKAEPVQPQVSEDRKDSGVIAVPQTNKTEAVAVTSKEKYKTILSAEVLAQKDAEITSLSRRLRDSFDELDRANRLFAAACADLGRVNEHLGLDPDDGGADPIIDAINEIKATLELARMARTVVHAGYVIQRPVKPLTRFSKIENAKARALACARGGKKAQVFALVPVGAATPGAEWVAA